MPDTPPCRLIPACAHCPCPGQDPPYLAFSPRLPTHARQHLWKNPRHAVVLYCRTHAALEYDDGRPIPPAHLRPPGATTSTGTIWRTLGLSNAPHAPPARQGRLTTARGGRRPGAGAPQGNRNAIRSGRYLSDPQLARSLAAIPAEHRETIIRALKGGRAAPRASMPAVLRVLRPSETPTTTTPDQSNALVGLAVRLDARGFYNAVPFLRQHFPIAQAIEDALDYLDDLEQDHPDQFSALANPAGFLRDAVHQATARILDSHLMVCNFCRWGQRRLTDAEQA